MALEALIWSAVGVLAPALDWALPSTWRSRLGNWPGRLEPWAPWVHGLAPTFAAAFSGALPPNYAGLYVSSLLLGWILPAGMLALLLVGVSAWLKRQPLTRPAIRVDHALLDEPRWGLYRGAGALTLAQPGLGLLLGLGLGLGEWLLRHQSWRAEARRDQRVCLDLARLACSTIAFALSRNLWLTMAFQLGLLALLPEDPASDDGG